jgi:hypothetical protein
MAIYTLSLDYINGGICNANHLHNVFLKFCNPSSEHKAAIDNSKTLLTKYIEASANNVDLQTWLDWMCRTQETHFEIVNVNIPSNISDEEMWLKVASATKPNSKLIVNTHQCWRNFNYLNGHSIIKYNNIDVHVLDKDEAYKELNTTKELMKTKNNPWQSGTFYLFAFVFILAALIVAFILLPLAAYPIVIIAALIGFSVVNAYQLRNDEMLSEKSFLSLMALSFKGTSKNSIFPASLFSGSFF